MPLPAVWQEPCPAADGGSDNRVTADDSNPTAARLGELNDTIRYTTWPVYRIEQGVLGQVRSSAVSETVEYLDALENKGVTVRGVYDVAGLRADADYMIWWYAQEIEQIQAAYSGFRRT